MGNLKVFSSSFENGKMMPSKYTCEGENVSPEISWGELPEGVVSLALICDDPDAPSGDFVHWVIFNIPPELNSLPEGVPIEDIEAVQGVTDYGRSGYGCPCPPRGLVHHYHFKLYGLDKMLEVEENITKYELLEKMESHIVAKGELVGLYSR